jgi:hypothetical protein
MSPKSPTDLASINHQEEAHIQEYEDRMNNQ